MMIRTRRDGHGNDHAIDDQKLLRRHKRVHGLTPPPETSDDRILRSATCIPLYDRPDDERMKYRQWNAETYILLIVMAIMVWMFD